MRVDSAKRIAKGKGVHREEESEGSQPQTSGLTNRNHIRHRKLGKVAQQTDAQNYPEAYGVDVADIWGERLRSYPGRSHGRAEAEQEARLKQDSS